MLLLLLPTDMSRQLIIWVSFVVVNVLYNFVPFPFANFMLIHRMKTNKIKKFQRYSSESESD